MWWFLPRKYHQPSRLPMRHKSGDHGDMQPASPIPTLEQLRRGTPWCWIVCERCLHRTPLAFVPLIIRWGPDASSDMLRRSARCTKCGRKGAVLQHPSWAGMHIGFEPFPKS